ncbi:MAG: DUF3795 domain-containing protein [Chloroflexi bacterium]|nr:MAG: DUF3795 domain-containing protein [Chloroflexota bacterium]
MKIHMDISTTLLAPCGMNCAVCYAHLRAKKPCPGCRGQDASKPEHCRKCKIKDCAISQEIDFCFECPAFPCATIKRLDKSYRQRYQVSLIDNAIRIKTVGARQYLIEEKEKWTCSRCGGVISLHDRLCSKCGKEMKRTDGTI